MACSLTVHSRLGNFRESNNVHLGQKMQSINAAFIRCAQGSEAGLELVQGRGGMKAPSANVRRRRERKLAVLPLNQDQAGEKQG
jgi:hypothetical protein